MIGKEINNLIRTGETAEQAISAEAIKAAEAHAEKQIADLEQELEKRKRSMIKVAIMMVLAALILIFSSMQAPIK